MLVSTKQRGNPLLKHIRHVLWEYSGAIAPDYLPSAGTAVLYISLKYHALHPTYLYKRLREVRSDYRLRVVLVYTDVSDVERLLLDISRIAILCDWTVVCAATLPEAARYLETWRVYEHKPATAIKERVEDTYLPKVTELLTSIRSINKTDVLTLLSRFHSVAGVMSASLAELQTCPGIAEKKAQRIHDAFHKPLLGGGHRGSASSSAHASSGADSSAVSAAGGGSDGVPHDPATALRRLLALAGNEDDEDGDGARDTGGGEDVEALEAMTEVEARDRGRGRGNDGSLSSLSATTTAGEPLRGTDMPP
jgi:DNA excision repair protein ERCC-1